MRAGDIWIDKFGHAMFIQDMKDSHIINALKIFLKRRRYISEYTENEQEDTHKRIVMLKKEMKRRNLKFP